MLYNTWLLSLCALLTTAAASDGQERCTTEYGVYSHRYVPKATYTSTSTCWHTTTKTVGRSTKTVGAKCATKTSTKTIKVTRTGSPKVVTTTVAKLETVVSIASTTVTAAIATVTGRHYPPLDTLPQLSRKQKRSAVKEPRKKYPSRVSCTKTVKKYSTRTVTKTVPVYTLTPKSGGKTVTTTKTVTSSYTIHPTRVATVTTNSVTTAVSTVTSTIADETTTVYSTISGPTPTACAADNLFRGFERPAGRVYTADLERTSSHIPNIASSPYECCLTCITMQGCAGSYFDPQQPEGERCLIIKSNTCTIQRGQAYAIDFRSFKTVQAEFAITISNGYCGRFAGGGQQR